jgi:pimeloyl-ACP methyl ester carboxylesterase
LRGWPEKRRTPAKPPKPLPRPRLVVVALPFAVKARYARLSPFLLGLVSGDPKAQALLDQFTLDETSTAGGSPPGEATYCQEALSRELLEREAHQPVPALHCDGGAVARQFLSLCGPYFSKGQRAYNFEKELGGLRVPAVFFGGTLDPIVPWHSTARAAALMPNAGFVLIRGGHTPVDEGGACFAKVIDDLAAGRPPKTVDCTTSETRRQDGDGGEVSEVSLGVRLFSGQPRNDSGSRPPETKT